ncbi:hypothetical protein [Fibrisoma montanum]|nr:hypothetical protein [Fibrisoma montanum]
MGESLVPVLNQIHAWGSAHAITERFQLATE